MKGLLTLVWIGAFFGLCWYGFEYVEKHDSTAHKTRITELEGEVGELKGEVEELRSQITELSNKRNTLKRKFLNYFPSAVSCEKSEECEPDMVCDPDLAICIIPLSDPTVEVSIISESSES